MSANTGACDANDAGRIMLHSATFGVNVGAGIADGNGMGSNPTSHFVDGLVNMRVVSVEALHDLVDLVDLEDLQHANTFVTYVQHSTVVEQLNSDTNNCVRNGVCTKRQRRQQLLKIPNRMTELLSRVTANLNCYNNMQRHRRHQGRQQQQQTESMPSPNQQH